MAAAMQTRQGQCYEIYLVADFWWNVSLDESGVVEIPQ